MEDVLFQIMLEMATVMMKTTILAAILTMTTVVAPMSIQIIAVYVYALNKNIIQADQNLQIFFENICTSAFFSYLNKL